MKTIPFKYILPASLFVLTLSCNQPEKREIIKSKNAPETIGPYSQAVKVGNTLYVSGQIAINPLNGKMEDEDIVSQTDRIMENIGAILHEANMSYKNIVSSTVYLRDLSEYSTFNQIYSKYFIDAPPSRSTVEVSNLPKNALLEISVIAVKD